MFAPDLFPVIIVAIFILIYSPLMTVIFLNQRFDLNKGTPFTKQVMMIAIFTIVLLGEFVGGFLFENKFNVWMFLYALAITVLVVWDRIAKRVKNNS